MLNIFKSLFSKENKKEQHNNNINKVSNINTQKVERYIAPVIDEISERQFNKDYRLSSDNIDVIRINQGSPKGLTKKAKEFIEIMGLTKENRHIFAEKFIKGSNRRLELRKEPTNPYDSNAIEVYGYCEYEGQAINGKLGYIPKAVAAELSNIEKLGATVKYMTLPYITRGLNIKIDIWTERAKPTKIENIEKQYKKIRIPKDPVDRNLKGIELEKEGDIDNAIEFYELNIQEGFEGNHPYNRLAIIYRKRKQYTEEIRVLERGIEVFSKLKATSSRMDIEPKLNKFKERLIKTQELLNK